MERKISFTEGEFYHIYNRGNDRRTLFLDEHDYSRFMNLLYLCNSTKPILVRDIPTEKRYGFERADTLVDIGAYCLMPNHFHLLLHEKQEAGISMFMKKLQTGYSMYFNRRHTRTGKLFEGVFRAEHADDDTYLEYLFAYVHLNPVKLIDSKWKERGIQNQEKTLEYLEGYPYSSFAEYSRDTLRREKAILERQPFPDYFSEIKDFTRFITDWLEYSKEILYHKS